MGISPRGGLGVADGDGDVDFDDLNLVNEHWGEVCHPVAPNCSPFSELQMASGSSAAANESVPAYIAALGIVSVADYRSRLDAVDSEADRLSLNLELLTSYWSYGQ